MSAYAASISDRSGKAISKPRKSKSQSNGYKSSSKSSVKISDGYVYSIQKRILLTMIWCFETYIAIAFGMFVVVYILGRRLFLFNKRKGNLHTVGHGLKYTHKKTGSYKDLSSIQLDNSTEAVFLYKPPKCLQDPELGVHKFIKIQGVNLHYTEAGKPRGRPPMLLIHGAMDFWFTWRKLVPTLATKFRVYCLDLRGCGDSEKPLLRSNYTMEQLVEDVACFISAISEAKADSPCNAILMGVGWGGQICWSMAEKYPGLIRKMILIHSPHPYAIRSYYRFSLRNCYKLWQLLVVRLPLVSEWAAQESELVASVLQPLISQGHITEEELQAYLYNFSRREDLTGSLHHLRNWSVWCYPSETPKLLSTPTLLLMGDSDSWLPVEAAYKSSEYVERIRTRVLVGASNWSTVTHSEVIIEELASFLGEPSLLRIDECSSDEEDDSSDEDSKMRLPSSTEETRSIMGRMMGAGLSVMTRWNTGQTT